MEDRSQEPEGKQGTEAQRPGFRAAPPGFPLEWFRETFGEMASSCR